MENLKVICLDDSNKPNEIKQNNWVKKGEKYTPIRLLHNPIYNTKAFQFEEIETGCPEYSGYNIKRFGISEEDLLKLININELEIVETI